MRRLSQKEKKKEKKKAVQLLAQTVKGTKITKLQPLTV